MAILKCKMCGGNIEPIEGQHYGTCDSCGNIMTLPDASEEKIVNLFNRANHYRMQSEFDKALATYENILIEDPNNAEAHWGCVLSKFGVEYVEDPKTHKHIPTLHRVQKESVLVNLEYKAALANADSSARELYEKEADQIEAIQKKILSVANNEDPYDIFICYKESDAYGKRTMDSVLAQDIYQQLSTEGYRIFFSRITLENKIGVEYEPYIFSALNSAKIMLVVGTKPDYFNAVWVKNEWARFLALAKNDSTRLLIPCYRDMDAYELPEELAIFQSQDMSRIGFIQDLKYGIRKILTKADTSVSKVITTAPGVNVDALLKRAMLSLEDAEWDKASKLLEQVLNQDPENATAYVGKLMAEVKVNKEENLGKRAVRLSDSVNYQKAIRFADDVLKSRLQWYNNEATAKYEKITSEKKEAEKKRTEDTEEIQKFVANHLAAADKKIGAGKLMLKSYLIGIVEIVLFAICMVVATNDNYYEYEFVAIAFIICACLTLFCTPFMYGISPSKNGKLRVSYDLDKNAIDIEEKRIESEISSFVSNYIAKRKKLFMVHMLIVIGIPVVIFLNQVVGIFRI